MNRKIQFGIIGLGHIGKRHAKCVLDHPQADLSATCDILPVEKLQCEDTYASVLCDYDDLIYNKNIDVVNICTPNYLHANMAIDALKAGKHVVIEKPMALSSVDAQKIIDTSKRENRLVFCVMQNRFSPSIIWLKEIVSKKKLGRINMVSIHCFWNRNHSYYLDSSWHGSYKKDGGPLFTQFSHFIDILYLLFGSVKTVETEFFSFNKKDFIEFEDSGIIKLKFTNSIVGVLNYSTAIWNKNFESSITIIGEKGTVKIGGQYMDEITYCDIQDCIPPDIGVKTACNDYGTYQGSASNHDKMIDNVINVLREKQEIHTNALDGLNVVRIIETIYNHRK
tara:strand:- start:844 stop:1854 length:1011 start_codon:yes stop_codon:yes gene_type:complete